MERVRGERDRGERSVGWEGNLAKLVGNFIVVYSDLLQLLPTPIPVPHLITHRRRDGQRGGRTERGTDRERFAASLSLIIKTTPLSEALSDFTAPSLRA